MNHWEQLVMGESLLDENGDVVGFEEKLIWDGNQKTLYLHPDSVRNELNVDLEMVKKDYENSIAFLREISQLLYSYILKKKPAVLHDKTKYFLHYDKRNKRILYLCMVDLIRYALYSGGNIAGYQPAINFNESGMLDIEKIRDERIMSFVTDSILKTNHLIDRNFVDYFELPSEEENDGTW